MAESDVFNYPDWTAVVTGPATVTMTPLSSRSRPFTGAAVSYCERNTSATPPFPSMHMVRAPDERSIEVSDGMVLHVRSFGDDFGMTVTGGV